MFLKLQNLKFWVFSCFHKILWVHYDHINTTNTIWKHLFNKEQPLKWKLNNKNASKCPNLVKKKFLILQNTIFQDKFLPFLSHDLKMEIIKQLWTGLYYSPISLVYITPKLKNISHFLMTVWVTKDPTGQALDTKKPLVKALGKKELNWPWSMLQWFIRFPDFTEFTELMFRLKKTPLNTVNSTNVIQRKLHRLRLKIFHL